MEQEVVLLGRNVAVNEDTREWRVARRLSFSSSLTDGLQAPLRSQSDQAGHSMPFKQAASSSSSSDLVNSHQVMLTVASSQCESANRNGLSQTESRSKQTHGPSSNRSSSLTTYSLFLRPPLATTEPAFTNAHPARHIPLCNDTHSKR